MSRFKRALLWAALIAVVLLALLSVYGAFQGAEPAQAFFNSVPLAVYWLALATLLGAGIVLFRRLQRVPALLLMHIGSILVLLGAMRGSNGGHAMAKRLFGIDKIPQGQLGIFEQTQENRVRFQDSNEIRELPFFARLHEFRIEYYRPGELFIQTRAGQHCRLPAEAGRSLSLGGEFGTVKIQRVFENFKIDMEGDKIVTYDAPGGSNPALEVLVEKPGLAPQLRRVFEPSVGHMNPNAALIMDYRRMISDYISDVEIVKDGQVVAAKKIEVNHPLHYGGYHLYQHSYGEDKLGVYTVLMVVSDSGLNLIYSGYAMLTVGVFWHFWGRRVGEAVQSCRRPASVVASHPE